LEKRKVDSENSEAQNREKIAALAYEFWKARGCPQGTPDEDWFRAEREIARSNEMESRESPEGSMGGEEADLHALRFPVRSEISRTFHGTSKRA
jgi:Protein of unknown function (DUF2934).